MYFFQNGEKVFLTLSSANLSPSREIKGGVELTYFTNSQNISLGAGNEILVKFTSLKNLDTIENKYKLTLVKKITSFIYLYRVKNTRECFRTSNQLYLLSDIEYAHPNFTKNSIKR